jgi:hypothetical protein
MRLILGPREVGKTSLVRSFEPSTGDPAGWPIPYVLPVYLEMSADVTTDIIPYIADAMLAVTQRVLTRYRGFIVGDIPELGPDGGRRLADPFAFTEWSTRLREAFREPIAFLVILDEVQALLTRLGRGAVDRVVDGLRAISDAGAIALMWCGSVTEEKITNLVFSTRMKAELRRFEIGFLGRNDTFEVFSRGLRGGYVLPQALAEVFRLTEGYPNHVHLLGEEIAGRLRTERRRVVSEDLVIEAGQRLALTEQVTEGILEDGLEGLGQNDKELVAQLATYGQDTVVIGGKAELRSILQSRWEGLDRFRTMGLIRQDQSEQYCWANELINLRVQDFVARLLPRNPGRLEEAPLRAAGFQTRVSYTLEPALTRQISLGEQRFIAKRIAMCGHVQPADRADPVITEQIGRVLDARLAELSRLDEPTVQRYYERYGDWFIFEFVEGIGVDEKLKQHRATPLAAKEAVRIIASACDTVGAVGARANITHGNLTPAHLIVNEGAVSVIDWGHGLWRNTPSPISGGSAGYMSPGYELRSRTDTGGARYADDVYALGVILYQMLHPTAQRPAGDPTDPVDLAAALESLLAPEPVIACVAAALSPRDEDRYPDAAAFAAALRRWLPSEPGSGELPIGQARLLIPVPVRLRSAYAEALVASARRHDRLEQLRTTVARVAEHPSPRGPAAAVRDLESFSSEVESDDSRPETLARLGADLIRAAQESDAAGARPPTVPVVQEIVDYVLREE